MAPSSSPHHSGNLSAKFIKDQQGKMVISPRDLSFVWGQDNRYWNVPNKADSAAELYQVSWLDVTGLVHETNPNKNYEVGFRVSFSSDAFGWGKYPVYIMTKRGKEGKTRWTKVNMNPNQKGEFEIIGKSVVEYEKIRSNEDSSNGMMYFGLYEVWSGKWKGGLKIRHAFIRELP